MTSISSSAVPPPAEWFGQIDVYLFDQILRGRVRPGMRFLDAGCGHGRNSVYLFRTGYEVHGVDQDTGAVAAARSLARQLAPPGAADRFRVAQLSALPFPDAAFDFVIASAVLHFAPDDRAFEQSLNELWRVLNRAGLLFVRTASTVGIEHRVRALGGRRYALPDGTDRYLVDDELLLDLTERMGGTLLDPIKTTVVQRQRAMTTWVVQKR